MNDHPLSESSEQRPRIVLCGMNSPGSALGLRVMLDLGFEIVAVVAAHGLPEFPTFEVPAGQLGFIEHAEACGLPVHWVETFREPGVRAALAAAEPDLLIACCFPLRVPRSALALPRFGALNIHPSLLPAWRGVEPLFWPLRVGACETGVTVHAMDAGFDTGPILAQARLPIPDGVRLLDLEADLIATGIRMLPDAIASLIAGTAQPLPQDDTAATPAPLPAADDLVVPTDRPARWAFNFVRGVAPVYGPLTLRVTATGEEIPVADALAVDPAAELDRPFVRNGAELVVRFAPGVVRFVPAAG